MQIERFHLRTLANGHTEVWRDSDGVSLGSWPWADTAKARRLEYMKRARVAARSFRAREVS